jgi:hypothetical protein
MTDELNSPTAVLAMRRRHLQLALEMQALAARGLDELRQRMERGQPLRADECKALADAGLELEKSALPEPEIMAKKPN